MIDKNIFEEIFNKSLNSIGILDEEGKYLLINKAHGDLLGYTLEDLTGKTPEIHLKDRFNQILKDIKEKGYFSGEVECITKDRRKLSCFLSAYKVVINGKTYYVGIKTDIADLKENACLIDTITKETNFGFAIYKDKFLYVNPYFIEITGFQEDEIKNIYVWEIFEFPYNIGTSN
ncbi:hypothetical protein JCM14244_12910 [Venenivibrio stagnispumantis]|uniref:PAS domain S-box-containing protein n=1 Tax=Venenivibrio stagnispumantis TaxID=407998 RepID=A0AA45WMV3_9AQUI|nr:PAS domain S-box protein [Venenivibrio stagnispumantis]MCW4573763.1 PAS domain S-box protein [Venenivibrio stagnispumantis]SMP15094.1 PAS domain S-box-containing protein [Venenivibrio stagnispumantis]